MSAQTSWVGEVSALNQILSLETEYAGSAKVSPDGDELSSRGLPGIIATSAALRSVLGMVPLVGPTDATVLINRETATGKELIAEAIHKWSHRSKGAFVKINCAAIPAGLLESELFGHERGAYTVAVTRQKTSQSKLRKSNRSWPINPQPNKHKPVQTRPRRQQVMRNCRPRRPKARLITHETRLIRRAKMRRQRARLVWRTLKQLQGYSSTFLSQQLKDATL